MKYNTPETKIIKWLDFLIDNIFVHVVEFRRLVFKQPVFITIFFDLFVLIYYLIHRMAIIHLS